MRVDSRVHYEWGTIDYIFLSAVLEVKPILGRGRFFQCKPGGGGGKTGPAWGGPWSVVRVSLGKRKHWGFEVNSFICFFFRRCERWGKKEREKEKRRTRHSLLT